MKFCNKRLKVIRDWAEKYIKYISKFPIRTRSRLGKKASEFLV